MSIKKKTEHCKEETRAYFGPTTLAATQKAIFEWRRRHIKATSNRKSSILNETFDALDIFTATSSPLYIPK